MAVKKKKKAAAKKAVKARTPKKPARKTAAKRVTARKPAARKAAAKTKAARKTKPKARGEFGEGNYKASKRFRTDQEAFVKTNKAKIPALGKAAETALEGPEGETLRVAEAEAAGHAAGEG